MSFRLSGIGTAVPKHSISQTDAAKSWASLAGVDGKKARTIQALYRRSGVKKRHSSLLEDSGNGSGPIQTLFEPARDADDRGPSTEARMKRFESDAPGLAKSAAQAALADAGMNAGRDHPLCHRFLYRLFRTRAGHDPLRSVGSSPHGGENPRGLHGMPRGLERPAGGFVFAGADPEARVLVSSVELCTLHMSYDWDPDTLVANSLFGDGSAAVVGVGEASASQSGHGTSLPAGPVDCRTVPRPCPGESVTTAFV